METEALEAGSGAPEREAALWRAFKQEGSVDAREQLFTLYLGLARRIAARHINKEGDRTVEYPDLCQLAYTGLLEAIDRFDPEVGVSFGHYAKTRISGSVIEGLRHGSERHEQVAFRQRVRRERGKSLAGEDFEALSSVEALERLVDAAVGLALGFMLEIPDGGALEVRVDRAPNAYDSVAWKELLHRLHAEIESLPERERLIVLKHYREGIDFDRLADLLRLSKGRISQLHRRALAQLKVHLHEDGRFWAGN